MSFQQGLAGGEAMAEGLSQRATRRTASSVAINIDDISAAGPVFSVGPDDENFKGLVKDRRFDCFRRLGGSAGIAAALASSIVGGIRGDGPDLQRRRELFGVNTYPKRKTKSLCGHFWYAVRDVYLIVLLVCGALSLGFGIKEHGVKDGWYDGVGIFVSVFLIAAMSAVGNHCHAKLFDQLNRDSKPGDKPVNVIRGTGVQHVLTSDVVVGDVVILNTGDIVPADGVVVREHVLEVQQYVAATTFSLQVLMVEVSAKFIDTQRLSWRQWGVCGVVAVMSWPVALIFKFIPVPDKPFHEFLPKFRFGFFSR